MLSQNLRLKGTPQNSSVRLSRPEMPRVSVLQNMTLHVPITLQAGKLLSMVYTLMIVYQLYTRKNLSKNINNSWAILMVKKMIWYGLAKKYFLTMKDTIKVSLFFMQIPLNIKVE